MERISFVIKISYISRKIECPHTNREILVIAQKFMSLSERVRGVFVECGAYKGGSTAKLSIISHHLGRKLFVFDSFTGIPKNYEIHSLTSTGELSGFNAGDYKGSLKEVKENVRKYGEIESCEFYKGFFEKTLPKFDQQIAGIFVDVDLAASNKAVLKHLYKKISPGGIYICHDGHLKIVCDVYADKTFWNKEVGFPRPRIPGLYKNKLFVFKKVRKLAKS